MQDSEYKHNFHTHTYRCKHASGDAVDYCKFASENGMKTIGFSDHAALPDDRWLSARMRYTDLEEYIAAVKKAKRDYPELRVLLGMECEYVPEFHGYFEDELFGKYEFDYLVGGPHYFSDDDGEWLGTYRRAATPRALMQYAKSVQAMIESGLFEFIAHPDLFGVCYTDWDENTVACSRDILSCAAATNVGLEINALGCRKIARKKPENPLPLYPWLPFWELASDYDVEVVVNSDAHRPTDLQLLTSEAEKIRLQCGLKAMDPDSIGNRQSLG